VDGLEVLQKNFAKQSTMISSEEFTEYLEVGQKGCMHPDININMHAQTLLEELHRYRDLTNYAAKSKLEESIRRNARQVLRNRSSSN
jgi:hypothetical protein